MVLTQDWHPSGHRSFASAHPGRQPLETVAFAYGPEVVWPDHCVQGTPGAQFHAGLQIPHAELVLRKGFRRDIDSYSAFYENDHTTPTGLAGYLRERGLTRLFLAGLALDFCVRYSAEDAQRCDFDVMVVEDACRGIDVAGSMDASRQASSTTDPQAKLYKKGRGKEAKLCFMGHALMENRHGLVVQAEATEADGTAERKAALEMIDRQAPGTSNRLTLGADKAYDAREFVADLRQKCVTPHVAQKTRSSAIDGRTTRHTGYAVSSRKRKLVEEAFGWAKTIAGCAKVKVRGLARVGFHFTLAMAAYNLIRLPKLIGQVA